MKTRRVGCHHYPSRIAKVKLTCTSDLTNSLSVLYLLRTSLCLPNFNIMESTPSFPLFNNLPTELRVKVWEYSLPGPRVVPVRYSRAAKQ